MNKSVFFLLLMAPFMGAQAQQSAPDTGVDPQLAENEAAKRVASSNMEYVGDDIRVGIGWDSEFDLTGELMWVFSENADSAWIGEGWFADGAAAGLKLNYHWLHDGVSVAVDEQGNPVYKSGRVMKAFVAADQNEFDDRKLTFGGGMEKENLFWSFYGSRSISGRRDISTSITAIDRVVTGVIDNHTFTRTDTLQTITDVYAHPYEWGLGFRFGGYIEEHNMRLRGGLDFEDGKFGSRQTTVSASLDKYFSGGHGVSLRVAYADKDGRFELDKSDFRGGIFYTYDFGGSYRPSRIYRQEQVVVEHPDQTTTQSRVVSNQVKIESRTQFDLDKSELKPEATQALDEIVSKILHMQLIGRIRVVGHTCDLGSNQYNMGLSQRRARAVAGYLSQHGIDPNLLVVSASGEEEPRYPNDVEENRSKNRRVEIEFLTARDETQQITVTADPTIEWQQVEVPQEAAWIRRALRNPIRHKRVVDYYRVEESTSTLTEGVVEIDNTGPEAVDDQFQVEANSSGNVFTVLDNDSDGEGDSLSIIDTSNPANGTISIVGDSITYAPNSGFSGIDSFTYTIEDGFGGTDTATVTVRVQNPNVAPVAVDDDAQAEQDASVSISVLDNDSDADGDTLSITEVSTPANGSAVISGSSIVYTPAPGFSGNDSFTYTISDGMGGTATAQVVINVRQANRSPVANPDEARTAKNTSVVIDVLANDVDPDGDPLTVVNIILDDHPKGSVAINPDGSLTYTPDAGWWGGDVFSYTISDGRGGTDTAAVVLRVTID